MKPGGRIAAAIEILTELARTRRPVADLLKDWGYVHRFAGAGDRAAIGSLVFDALRRRASFAWRMGSDEPRALALATFALSWGKGVAGLDAALTGEHAPAALTEAERTALGAPPAADLPPHAAADVPEWLFPSFVRAFGDRAITEGAALATRAPVDLRANPLRAKREAVLQELSPFHATATPFSPHGVRIAAGEGEARAPHVEAEPGYKRGQFEVQDEGSQLAALLAGARPGMQVVDLCAGAGGKTLALAALMSNRGQIYAYDSERRRFGDIEERLQRAGVRNVQIRLPARRARGSDQSADSQPADPATDADIPGPAQDAEDSHPIGVEGAGPGPAERLPASLADLENRADLVLADAPCTGTGTWRRRPDAKWRLAPGALASRIAEQDAVLATAGGLVKPGGRLAYVTCSVLPEENEDRIAAFLATHADYTVEDAAAAFTAATGAACPAPCAVPLAGGMLARLTPATTQTDGFSITLLRRRG